MRRAAARITAMLGVVATLSGCMGQINAQMQCIDSHQWSPSTPAQVGFTCEDTTALHDLWVVLRATSDCEINQLPLRITTIDPEGFRHQDKLYICLSESRETVARTSEIETLWRTQVRLSKLGEYLVQIAPEHASEPCNGITAAGIRWESTTSNNRNKEIDLWEEEKIN